MAIKKINVIIPDGYKPLKKDVDAAWVLARHYQTIVNILKPINRYRVKTPDFLINGDYYELKVLTSSQVRQLLVLLDQAKKQADNIVIDIRKTKITEARVIEVCSEFMRKHKKHRVFLIITADKVLIVQI